MKITPQDHNMPDTRSKEFDKTFVFLAPNPRHKPKYTKAVEARVYWSRNGQTCYALFWARSRDGKRHTRGHGKAGGGGYCKTSAAIDYAVSHAGIEMKHFDGHGEQAAKNAIAQIANRMGWKTGDVMEFGG